MKKAIYFMSVIAIAALLALFSLAAFAVNGCASAKGEKALSSYNSRAAYLVDYQTGEVLYERNADSRYPIASMVKIMTLSIVFDEIEAGRLSVDDVITVSEEAAGMGGSQMFLDAGSDYKLGDLIKGVVVASANDASVAIAETVAGSKEAFIDLMNEKAAEMGLNDTRFVNVTGLPGENQYSTAKDVTRMLGYLLKHKEYFDYSTIYMENFTHPGGRVSELVNTNKLVRFYKGCDGGKTGFTSDAMYCLSATAKRGEMRVIATVLGAESSQTRNKEISSMFNYAFANYNSVTLVEKGAPMDAEIFVKGAKYGTVNVEADGNLAVLEKRGEKGAYKIETEIFDNLKAPIGKGQRIGVIRLVSEQTKDIKAEVGLVASEDIPKRGLSDSLEIILDKWFMGI